MYINQNFMDPMVLWHLVACDSVGPYFGFWGLPPRRLKSVSQQAFSGKGIYPISSQIIAHHTPS